MKHCTNCGLAIAQDVTTCPRCGAYVPYTSTTLATPTNTTPTPSSPDSQDSGTRVATPYVDFGLPAEGISPSSPTYQEYSSMPSTSSAHDGETKLATPGGQPGMQVPRPAPPTPPYGMQQQGPIYLTPPPPQNSGSMPMNAMNARPVPAYGAPMPQPQMPYSPPPQARRGLSRGIVALILILTLLLVFSGVGLIYYSTVARPAQLHAQATSTAQAISTNDAHSTAIANTQATGTSIASSNATATAQAQAQAQATAQAQGTATALQAIYTQATQGTPALNSSLAAQDGNNWDVNDTTDGGGCGFNGGSYHSTLFSKNFYFPCFAHSVSFSNFAFQVQMIVNEGDEGGLVFRSNSNTDAAQYYLFSINQKGTYSLVVSKDRSHNTALADDVSSAIKTGTGQTNTIAVVAKGGTFYLYINKKYIGGVSDSTYSSGLLGVFASDSSTTTDVSFSNAQVWRL